MTLPHHLIHLFWMGTDFRIVRQEQALDAACCVLSMLCRAYTTGSACVLLITTAAVCCA